MSETDFLKLKKHDNVETNTEKFDIENYLNGNFDKIDKNAGEVNTNILNINSKNKQQDTNIEQLQENTETSSNKIAKLEKELKEAQEDFYQNSIRGQASGEYIHVEDSSNCRARIGIGGNHEQETRSGKNKIDLAKCQVKTYNGITSVYNKKNNSITFDGTCTADNTSFHIFENGKNVDDNNVLIKNNSTLLAQYVNGSINGYSRFRLSDENWGDKIGLQLSALSSTNKKVYATYNDVDATIKYLSFRFEKGTILNNFTVQLMLTDTVDTEYEMYGVMPSPDYLSEIKTVGSNVNIFDKEKYRNINNWSNSQGFFIYCKLDEEDTEKFKKIITGSISLKGKLQNLVFGISTTNNASSFNNQYRMLDNGTIKNITYDFSNAENIYLCIGNVNKIGTDKNEINLIFDNYNIKFEKGTVATPWSPHGQGCVKVTKCNTNLYDGKNEVGGINNDGSLSSTTDRWRTINYINVKSLKNLIIRVYDIETSGALGRYCLYDDKYNFLSSAQILNTKTDLKVDNASYLKFWFLNEKVASSAQVQVQVEEGTTAKEYNKHEEQSYIMPVQQEMLENDYFNYDNEEEVHTWGKLVLNGTEKIGISGASTDEILAVVYDINNAIDGFGYSNCFLYSSQVALNKLNVYNNGKNLRVCVDKSKFVDLESFKSKIIELYNAGTPVMIYYKLQTPTRLAFTDEQKSVAKELNNARTYKNVTNITTDSKAILSLDYAKDLETQNQKMQNEIDEIKQLLSTTQTSAMLLDNLQKEVESEVE